MGKWAREHKIEVVIFTVGALLRLTMVIGWRFRPEWGYDSTTHWKYVEYILQHASLPRIEEVSAAYHPPLYYVIAAAMAKVGAGMRAVAWFSFACGVARLGLIWWGLERHLENRRARIAGLSLAAMFPTSIYLDGMLGNESLNCLIATAATLLLIEAFRAERRLRIACVLGLALGLAALSKPSAVALLGAFGAGVILEALWSTKSREGRLKAALPWAATIAICLAVGGWWYARSARLYGAPLATNYEVMPEWTGHTANINKPFLDRRPLGFVFGWNWQIYRMPYYTVGLEGEGRFFPVLLASSFLDYYNINFSGLHDPRPDHPSDRIINWRPVSRPLLHLSRGAMWGGTIILLATLIAWAACLRRVWSRRDWGLLAALLVPLFATLAALSFAIKYPYNTHGVIKGVYLQFGMAPLYAMFGLAAAWASQRGRWPALAALLLALTAIAAYAICCRTGLFI